MLNDQPTRLMRRVARNEAIVIRGRQWGVMLIGHRTDGGDWTLVIPALRSSADFVQFTRGGEPERPLLGPWAAEGTAGRLNVRRLRPGDSVVVCVGRERVEIHGHRRSQIRIEAPAEFAIDRSTGRPPARGRVA